MAEQASVFTELREAMRHLEKRMDGGFAAIEHRFEAIDQRFEAIDRRFEAMDAKFDGRFEALDQKISRHFVWLTGMMVTLLIAVSGGLIAVVGALLARP